MSHEHRVKIQQSNILNALLEHVQGKREMSATQVSAGIALIRKILPDLSQTTIEGGENPLTFQQIERLIVDHAKHPRLNGKAQAHDRDSPGLQAAADRSEV
jgi:hypothetical protein